MPNYLTDNDAFLLLPNPNYNESAFADSKRSQAIDEAAGIGGVWSPLKSNGQWKVRQFAFDKAKWANGSAAETWVRDNRQAFKSFAMSPRRMECLEIGFSKRPTGSAPTEGEFDQIRSYMLEDIPAEDLYVRTMRLTNDQWGKHHVKLARGFQKSVIGTIPGKSLLLGHPESKGLAAEPIGRFFDGWVDRDHAGTEWGYAKFYLVKTDQNEHARAQIDGGVWQYASIGLELDQVQCSICGRDIMGGECRHIPGNAYPRSQVRDISLDAQQVPDDPERVYCGTIWRGQGQAIEGSIVFLPELNGTEIVAETQLQQSYLNGDIGQAKALMLSQAGDIDGADPEGEDQPGDAPEPGTPTPNDDEQEAEAMSEILEAKARQLEAEKAGLEVQLATATAELAALQTKHSEAETALREAEPLSVNEKAFRTAAVTELERLAGLIGRKAELDAFKSMAGDDLSGLPAEKVLGLTADWTKQFDALGTTNGRQSTPSDGEPADPQSVEVRRLALI